MNQKYQVLNKFYEDITKLLEKMDWTPLKEQENE